MDQGKARDFWKTVMNHEAELCAVLDAAPTDHGLQEGLQRIGRVVQTLRDAATDIDPLLTVEVDQVLPEGVRLRSGRRIGNYLGCVARVGDIRVRHHGEQPKLS
jgi:hypothetical protein